MSKKQIEAKYKRWRKILDKHSVEYTECLFYDNIGIIDFSNTSILSEGFYTGRYGHFLNDDVIQQLVETAKKEMTDKRINNYDVHQVMKKHNITMNEATIMVDELKKKTAMTKDRYISKYGEREGLIRWNNFLKKSVNTRENFIKRYGEDGITRWKTYCKKKSGLKVLIDKYGEIDGKKKFEEANIKRSRAMSLEGYIEKYGNDEGSRRYNERLQRLSYTSTSQWFIEKYGNDLGIEKYKESKMAKRTGTRKHFHDKYGKLEGEERYKKACYRKSIVFRQLVEVYGDERGTVEYETYLKNKIDYDNPDIRHIAKKVTDHAKNYVCKGFPVSKASMTFFRELQNLIGTEIIYGSLKVERKIFDPETKRRFAYDAYIPKYNALIEFHGNTWHPKPDQTDWRHPFSRTYEEVRAYDEYKAKIAKDNGYLYIEIFDTDVRLSEDREKALQQIKDKLNESISGT